MTKLGIELTDKEPVTGWEAIQPNQRTSGSKPACELIVRLAEDRLTEAWEKYDELLDKYHSENPGMTWPEYMVAKDKLLKVIQYAKSEHENACAARAAYYQEQP